MSSLDFEKDGPVDKENLLKHMQELDEGVVSEYLNTLQKHIQILENWRAIFGCVKSSDRCQKLLNELDENKLKHIFQIIYTLEHHNQLHDLKKLMDETFCFESPICGNKKALLFLETVKKIDPKKRDAIAVAYGNESMALRAFSEILLRVCLKLDAQNELAKLNDAQMDKLLQLVRELI